MIEVKDINFKLQIWALIGVKSICHWSEIHLHKRYLHFPCQLTTEKKKKEKGNARNHMFIQQLSYNADVAIPTNPLIFFLQGLI
jgi:hypothetical protein